MRSPVCLDFEAHAIEPRPAYPPQPVGVAVWEPGHRSRYYAWGHPTENNCTRAHAQAVLRSIWRGGRQLLFHNAAFDLEVARVHLGLPMPPWHQIEDTLYLAFLHNPNARQLGLKILADDLLDMPPEEVDALKNWVFDHVKNSRRSPTKWGRHIAKAPGKLVAPYAVGDVDRTFGLWDFYRRQGIRQEPYDRERRLLPVILQMERTGVPVDALGLEEDARVAERSLWRLSSYLEGRLGTKGLNLDSRDELADAMENAGLVAEWLETPTGQRGTSTPDLRGVGVESSFVDALELRSLLRIQLRTFVRPWLEMVETGGRIHCRWNPVRSADVHDAKQIGARTGRVSSSPNLQNVPIRERNLKSPVRGVKPLDLRSRIAAPRGQQLICGDQAQQELRVLAHFAGGSLAQSYRDNPRFDLHAQVQAGLPVRIKRWQTKNLFFARIYGAGIQKIADMIGVEYEVARTLKQALLELVPSMRALEQTLQKQQHCVTWGGRYCPVEPGREVNGRWMDFSYKLLNTLIQGSSADIIKSCMIQYHERGVGQLLATVHDELLVVAPSSVARQERRVLVECMQDIRLDVPMLATAHIGKTWRDAK